MVRRRALLGKTVDLGRLHSDIRSGELRGTHLFAPGEMDDVHTVVEMVIGRSQTTGETYSIKIMLDETMRVISIMRVRFQWECGGWRSKDTVLPRLPIHYGGNEREAGELLAGYLKLKKGG